MPEEGMTGVPPPGGAPPNATAQPPGQASGPGGASMPVPNRGIEIAALISLGKIMDLAKTVAAKLPVSSEAYKDVQEGIIKITKHIPRDMQEGLGSTGLQKLMMQQRQMGPQMAAMRAGQPPGAPPGGGAMPGAPPGGGGMPPGAA